MQWLHHLYSHAYASFYISLLHQRIPIDSRLLNPRLGQSSLQALGYVGNFGVQLSLLPASVFLVLCFQTYERATPSRDLDG